jgi:hypothetical protein
MMQIEQEREQPGIVDGQKVRTFGGKIETVKPQFDVFLFDFLETLPKSPEKDPFR